MNALESLSEYCGIVDCFIDARGAARQTTPEIRRSLLAAMGIQANDEAAARRALDTLRAADADRCLPPVHVHYQTGDPVELAIMGSGADAGSAADAREWRIALEDGGFRQGLAQIAPAGEGGHEAGLTPRGLLRIEEEIPLGYHTLTLERGRSPCSLIVTPGRCWLPAGAASGRRLWGVAAQLYLLRSATNWGIGDYGDLKSLVHGVGARGADIVGLNPLHAMFPDDPEQASPYSPASRLLVNVLNIDVATVAASMDCAGSHTRLASSSFQEALARCRDAPLVDYTGVTALKLPILRELFECCDRNAPDWKSFIAFRDGAGAAFERDCLFLALRSRFAGESPETADWHRWPEEYRRPDSAATRRFAKEHAEAVTFQAWLQYIADRQLQECSKAAAGMAVGLYRDLAVGAALGGAETWANPAAVVDGIHVGAPPDIYNPRGQAWGLPPFDPRALRAEGYRSFIDLVRANMRHAGGLRIDHVMALQQLYWVPEDRPPSEGAYVRYPLDDLVGVLTLESHRHQCLVVGEDLGTVPEGFRERMERARILSYRVLLFEKAGDEFIAPEEYPRLALAVAGSHDLPTLRAWRKGTDIALKSQLRRYSTDSQAVQAAQERDTDRAALERLLRIRQWLKGGDIDVEGFVAAAHELLASTRSAVVMLQLDDLTGEVDPVNVPTTSREYPNWRRRLSVSLEQLLQDPRFVTATATLERHRGAPPRRVVKPSS
jgi:4-alpha-glucanotransferase